MKKISLLLFFVLGIFFTNINLSGAQTLYCTQEVKLCSDGETYVSRGLPNCEFNACPGDPVVSCPVYDIMVPREGCDYVNEKDENGCDVPKLVCDDTPKLCTKEYMPVCGQPQGNCGSVGGAIVCTQVYYLPKTYGNTCELENDGATFLYEGECRDTICPELSPPANLEPGCEFVIEKNIGQCDTGKIVCGGNSDIALSTVIIPSLINLKQGQAFTVSSYASVKGFQIGTEITANSYLKNTSGKVLETCETSTETARNTLTNGIERIKNTCSINYFKNNTPDGETYSIFTKLDFDNILPEKNENNNENTRKLVIGNKQISCPVYSLVAPRPGCEYEYIKDENGCDIPKLVCDDELSQKIKELADEALSTYERKLEELDISNEGKVKMIDTLISRLDAINGPDKSITVQRLIEYLLQELEEMKTRFQDNDVDDILELFN